MARHNIFAPPESPTANHVTPDQILDTCSNTDPTFGQTPDITQYVDVAYVFVLTCILILRCPGMSFAKERGQVKQIDIQR
ncbi:MAG: hypothetical protein CL920_37440 [Deltaproteobacteria bacterium]|nr:hypothetical protein [Deltaproteobacteria bacterium]